MSKISQMTSAGAIAGDELLELSRLSTTVTITATTISAQAGDNSFNDSAGGFVTAGFTVGDQVRVQGFTGSDANNIFSARITALSAAKMVIGGADGDVIFDDAAGEPVTISKWETRRTTTQEVGDLGGVGGGGLDAYNNATAFTVYGDSFTVGVGASVTANRFTDLIATARGWTQNNLGTSGDMVADKADEVLTSNIGDGAQSLLMLGTNDQRTYTTDVNKQAAFKAGHAALIAWLSIPNARKQRGQARDSVTGTWTNNAEYGGALGIQSIVPASSATFTAYGSVVYVCTILQNSIAATFSVAVDGVTVGTFSCSPGATITSVNGRTFMPALIRIPGLSEGPHSVVVTVVTASSGNPVYVLWVAGNGGHRSKSGPNLWVGNVPRFTPAGYAASGGSDAVVAKFNAMIRAADGLNIALVDCASRLVPATDLDTDGVHPDDSGHAAIAEAFLEGINQIQKPRTMNAPPQMLQSIGIAAGDESTAITTGTAKVTFHMPYDFILMGDRVIGTLKTAQASGSIFTVDVNEGGNSILATKITIDNTEETSLTAAAPPVVSDIFLARGAKMTIDVDQVGDGTAVGLKVWLIGVPAS
jgi:lysophospholipase L1-like esterase